MKYSMKKEIKAEYDDTKVQKAVVNDKYDKSLKRLKIATATLALGAVGIVAAFPISYHVYSFNNPNFNYNTVVSNLERYGGADFLINRNYDMAILGTSSIVSHLKATKNGIVKIGYDNSIPENIVEAFNETVNYLNQIFSVINPKYHFEIGQYKESNSNIWVRPSTDTSYSAQAYIPTGLVFSYHPREVKINYANQSFSYDKCVQKLIILHEFLHILLGCKDIFDEEIDYVSVLSYTDVNSIGGFLESKQYEARRNNDNQTLEKLSNFTSYMPVDLATLISVYGDSSKPENVKKYEELLKECMSNCRDVLGFRNYYKYHNSIEWLREMDNGLTGSKLSSTNINEITR